MRAHPTTAICAAVLLLTACGVDDGDPADQPIEDAPDDEVPVEDPADGTADDPAENDVTDPPDDDAAASDPLLGPEIETALDDAAERSGVPREELTIAVAELVTWPDGAAGCPEPDMMYTQALVDGFRIVIEADGRAYHYVGAEGQDPSYCENPQEPVS